jgi:hypothetical protein
LPPRPPACGAKDPLASDATASVPPELFGEAMGMRGGEEVVSYLMHFRHTHPTCCYCYPFQLHRLLYRLYYVFSVFSVAYCDLFCHFFYPPLRFHLLVVFLLLL